MKREIKFRGKVKGATTASDWVYGSLLIYGDGEHNIFVPRKYNYKLDSWNVEPSTVGQFSGLKDKNGKEIYEGDIIHIDCHPWLDWKELDSVNAEIVFDDYAWVAQWKNPDAGQPYLCSPDDYDEQSEYIAEMLGSLPKTIEVIGNIFDNPELLNR